MEEGRSKKTPNKGLRIRLDVAERAIEGCNGIMVHAGAAEMLVLGRQRRKMKRIELKVKAADNEGEDEEMADAQEEEEEVVDDIRATEHVIAVDWALIIG